MSSSTAQIPGNSNNNSEQIWDAVETYFECITTCSVDDGECITRCVEQLKETEE